LEIEKVDHGSLPWLRAPASFIYPHVYAYLYKHICKFQAHGFRKVEMSDTSARYSSRYLYYEYIEKYVYKYIIFNFQARVFLKVEDYDLLRQRIHICYQKSPRC